MFTSSEVIKAGTIQAFGGSTAPDGWLFCDGSAISRTLYADLFAVIGTTYGSGDGTTTFNLPNFIGLTSDNVPCCGNGLSLGLTNGTTNAGMVKTTEGQGQQLLSGAPGAYGSAVGQIAAGLDWTSSDNILVGITDDKSKSGIISSLSSASQKSLAIIKY